MGKELVPIDVTCAYEELKSDLKKFGPNNSFGSLHRSIMEEILWILFLEFLMKKVIIF